MCGIVGAVATSDVVSVLLSSLKRLEYRGYDSAGLGVVDPDTQEIKLQRVLGKVASLSRALEKSPLKGHIGIAHTRWATHGEPNTKNAHPQFSGNVIAVVHNGIIENHDALRDELIKLGYEFRSKTDTEVIAHRLHYYLHNHNLLPVQAIQKTIAELEGAYALGIMIKATPNSLYAVRRGSPLVIGLSDDAHYLASDPLALLPITQKFMYLEEGDLAEIQHKQTQIWDSFGQKVNRVVHTSQAEAETTSKGNFQHYMLKEIFDQPHSLGATLDGHILNDQVVPQTFGHRATKWLKEIKRIQIVACGTSYHASLVGKYWLESIAGIPTQVEIASENRYRSHVVEPNTLFLALSQSGETADTLAALRQAKTAGYAVTMAICNVSQSSLAREADLVFITRAGTEIGVAATKTFTAQLTALMLFALVLAQNKDKSNETVKEVVNSLRHLTTLTQKTLSLHSRIEEISHLFKEKRHALFLGRGLLYPIALEGALKLKEISYIHAEAYPAGELKHGPLALVDKDMPVILVASKNSLADKLESNIQEVKARGGEVFVFADEQLPWHDKEMTIVPVPTAPDLISPIIYTFPLQLLAYYIAVVRGTDVDQPRNLAKSVTVE